MPDPDQWRRRVGPEMERMFAASLGGASTASAPRPVFPQVGQGRARPRKQARRGKSGGAIAAAVVVGVGIGVVSTGAYSRLDQYLHGASADGAGAFPLKPAVAASSPAAAPLAAAAAPPRAPITVAAAPVVPAPAVPALTPPQRSPEFLLEATAGGSAPSAAAPSSAAPPRATAPTPASPPPTEQAAAAAPAADPANSISAQIAAADRALTQAYASARRAGVAETVLDKDQLHWQAIRADAASRSSVSLLAAYNSRIHDLGTMTQEARSERAQNDAFTPGAPIPYEGR